MKVFSNLSFRFIRVWQRDWEVYLTTWYVNFLPPLIEPLLYLFAFGFGLGTMVKDVHYHGMVVPYIQFFAPGIIAITIMFNAFYECLYGSYVRMYYQKTFDAIIATPLSLEDVVAGEIVWGAAKGAFASALMMVPIGFFHLLQFPSLLLIPVIGFAGGLLFGAFGMCFTAICPTIDTFNFPVFLLITPMMLFSGTFFPIDILPGWAQALALALPLTHLAELVRAVMLHISPPHLLLNLVMILAGTCCLFPLALHLMHRRLIH